MDSTRLADRSLHGERAFGNQGFWPDSLPGAVIRPQIAFRVTTADASVTGHGLAMVQPDHWSVRPQGSPGSF